MQTRDHRLAVASNYKTALMPVVVHDRRKLRAAWMKLPDHPTKPTLEQLEEWIHDATCNICGKTKQQNTKQLCLDHDHDTGEFRGFLCDFCNQLLGRANDQIEILRRAIAYLESPPARDFI